jgi:predicted SprT family Zn-dependent metalloprotease
MLTFKEYLIEAPKGESKMEILYRRAIKADDRGKIKILAEMWKFYKDRYFGSKLKPAGSIRFLKDTGLKFNRRGSYSPGMNQLAFSRRLFNAPFEKFREVFLHEMCHQATHLVSKSNVAHGSVWKEWMVTVGLNPNRLDYDSNETYLSDKEKVAYQKMKEVEKEKQIEREKAKADVAKKEIKVYPKNDLPAKYFNPSTKDFVEGLIVCPNDQQGKRWCFIKYASYTSYQIVPYDWFYKMDPKNEAYYTRSDYLEAAKKLRENLAAKKSFK